MQNQKKKRIYRVRKLAVITALSAILLIVSTYAWFVGTRTVNVSSFDVEIASTDSLLLSLDGETWKQTITVSKETLDDESYSGHTNNWAGRGLIPMSSIGEMDSTVSRMKIYEKASLTTTAGGYRLLASRVPNYTGNDPERDGYVVFDLFVKNFSGTQYLEELEELDEEAIYLTVDSAVTVATTGVKDSGIENSVRVAFTQIGRVKGTVTDAGIITGITCTTNSGTGVTGICRKGQIWEPNDLDHVKDAISWYETSCLKRTGADVTLPASYSGECGQVIDGKSYPTYAVNNDIKSSDNVDIYDGTAYNKYTATTLLTSYPYFTDTMKLKTGTARPTFMTLEPNSITKLRIYIYIEGQDVDNYDFASIGKKIAVKFGFTKQRFTEDDINYEGPDVNQGLGPDGEDLTPPVITLKGTTPMMLTLNAEYEEPGATSLDNVDGDLSSSIVITGTVNNKVPGEYSIVYTSTDAAGNVSRKVRVVIVGDN